jgi:hypothetical protein
MIESNRVVWTVWERTDREIGESQCVGRNVNRTEMISLAGAFPLALVPSSTPFYHNTMRFHTALRARSLLQRAPVGCTFGRRAIQTASSTRVPDFAFAFE